VLAAALACWLALETERVGGGWLVLAVGLAGAVAVAVALAFPAALGAGLGLLGASYAALLALDEPGLDSRAALVAAALVVTGELAGWSLELRTTSPDEPGGAVRRIPWIALTGVGALAVSAGVLALVDRARADGIAVEALGTAAALVALALLVKLAGAPRPP